MPQIHRTATVDDQAQLADDVVVGPNCVIEGPVKIGAGTKLIAQAYLKGPLTLGANNTIYPMVTIGLEPQDWKADPDKPGQGTVIGDGNVLREGVSIHRASRDEHPTTVGDRNYLMAQSHVAHDCVVGSDCMFANSALLGGHCEVGDKVILGGNCGVQQFCRIGRMAMLGGCEGMTADLPPFCMIHHTKQVSALNLIGLRRAGLRAHIKPLRLAFDLYYRKGIPGTKALEMIDEQIDDPLVAEFTAFIRESERGVTGYGESFKHRPWLKPEFYQGNGNGDSDNSDN
ncbi:MAG: acyl-ACP--UDP-N-acetylglucosamine O-acyltransferase [Phycisphaeraceae bacterium]|jgi:UDP-N-acetylglucosamine acyltransferase